MIRSTLVCLCFVLLSGCAVNQAHFDLRKRELFVSPNNHHHIQLDRTLYSFQFKVDEALNPWVPPADPTEPSFKLHHEFQSSVPQIKK